MVSSWLDFSFETQLDDAKTDGHQADNQCAGPLMIGTMGSAAVKKFLCLHCAFSVGGIEEQKSGWFNHSRRTTILSERSRVIILSFKVLQYLFDWLDVFLSTMCEKAVTRRTSCEPLQQHIYYLNRYRSLVETLVSW